MADPVLHIKDSYFFEVPRFLWRRNWQSLEEVPEFLRKAHPEATLADFNRDLSGKILIPQPFGQLKNLYEPASGFCISKFMILEVVVALLLFFLLRRAVRQIRPDGPPRGKWANAVEALVLFIRDQVARNAIGKKDGDKFAPLLATFFVFILGCNLMGMLPWLGTPTGAWGTTFALAVVAIGTTIGAGFVKLGPVGFFANMIPKIPLPWFFLPLTLAIQVTILLIEILGLLIRHTVLSIRLLANMMAGHLVILGLLGGIVAAAGATFGKFAAVATVTVLGCALFSMLEVFVAFLQAYIFTFLAALYISLAVHHH